MGVLQKQRDGSGNIIRKIRSLVMEIKATVCMGVTNVEIGSALANASDDDFAAIMLSFAKQLDQTKIASFGKVMAQEIGSNRRIVWEDILGWVQFYKRSK